MTPKKSSSSITNDPSFHEFLNSRRNLHTLKVHSKHCDFRMIKIHVFPRSIVRFANKKFTCVLRACDACKMCVRVAIFSVRLAHFVFVYPLCNASLMYNVHALLYNINIEYYNNLCGGQVMPDCRTNDSLSRKVFFFQRKILKLRSPKKIPLIICLFQFHHNYLQTETFYFFHNLCDN